MPLLPLPARRLTTVLRAVAVLGLLASLVGGVAGWIVLGRTAGALEASLALTEDTLAALDASAGVADDAVGALAASLSSLERTATDLDRAIDDGELLLEELAVLVREDVAGSVAAVDGSLPGLITVAGTIDTTLGTLSALPFGPDYDPEQTFSESLRALDGSLDGLPEQLVDQSALVEDAAASLGEVGGGVAELAAELAAFDDSLSATAELLGTYDETIAEGQQLVADARDDLLAQLWLSRAAVALLALAFAAMQVVPLQMAAMVDRRT